MTEKEIFECYKSHFEKIVELYGTGKPRLTAYFDIYKEQQPDGSTINRPIMVTNLITMGSNLITICSVDYLKGSDRVIDIASIKARLDNGFIDTYGTNYNYQRKGYGKYLMNIVKNESKLRGSECVYGHISTYDDMHIAPEYYYKANLAPLEAGKLYLIHHYRGLGFDITDNNNHNLLVEDQDVTLDRAFDFYQQTSKMQTTQTYPDAWFDIANNGGKIINQNDYLPPASNQSPVQ